MATPAAILSLLVKADGVTSTTKDLGALDASARKAGVGMDKAGESAAKASANHEQLASKTAAGKQAFDGVAKSAGFVALGVGAIGAAAVKSAANYESSMNTLKAVSGATDDQMKQLSKTAVKLGADTKLPGTSAQDAAEAMTEMIKAGVSLKDTMGGVRSVLVLSAAAQISNADAAEIASNALNAFKLKGKDVAMVADQLANTANASSVEIHDVADSFKMAAAVFAGFQKPAVGAKGAITELNVAIGLLGNAGIKGSDAGTSLKQMLLQLTGPSDKSAAAMRALYVAAEGASVSEKAMTEAVKGSSKERGKALETLQKMNPEVSKGGDIAYTAAGKMRSLKDIITLVAKGTKNMTQEQRNNYITQIFGADATRSVIALIQAGPAAYDKMEKAVVKQGSAQELANAKMKGFKGSLEALRSTLETLAINVGTKLLPALTAMAQKFTGIVSMLSPTEWTVLIGVIGTFAVSIWAVNAAMKAYEAVSTAATAATWLFNAALAANPAVLVVAALVAIGVALVIAYKKVDAFRNIVDTTFNWIKQNWPLLLAILAGPIGLAVLAIVKHAGEIKAAIVGAFNGAVSAVKGMADTITGLGSSAVKWVVQGVHDAVASLNAAGGWIVNRIKDGVEATAQALTDAAGWIKNRIVEFIHNEVDGFSNLGGWVVTKFVDGIKASTKLISDAADWLKDQVVKAVEHFFLMKSPSKVMADLGGNVAKGLIHGIVGQDVPGFIKAHLGGIAKLAGNLVSSGWKGLKGLVGGLFGGGGGSSEKSASGLVGQVVRAVSWARAHGWTGAVTSGFRSHAEQAALYARYLAGGPLAAKPGTSSHEVGQAVDVTDPAGFAAALANAPANSKIYNRLGAADPVHFSVSGYAAGAAGARKGWAMVGERGPELMRMSGGEKILPNNRISAAGNTVVVQHHYHGPVVQDQAFITYLRNLNQGFSNRNGKTAFGST